MEIVKLTYENRSSVDQHIRMNTHAIRYYQKYGFSLKAVHIGALEVYQKTKKGTAGTRHRRYSD